VNIRWNNRAQPHLQIRHRRLDVAPGSIVIMQAIVMGALRAAKE
jgi:hypothetical protein